METITFKSNWRVQNELKKANHQLDYYHNNSISKFKFDKFESKFNNPYDTSITILKSDIDNLRASIEISKRKLHELRVRIARGQTYNSDTYLYLFRWNRVADKMLQLIM
ncbi:MAG: hypothetical protein EOM74_01745 [Methanomicrobia archaeon]|nr:hypothetical protein [Methanomicrobia archaeon]